VGRDPYVEPSLKRRGLDRPQDENGAGQRTGASPEIQRANGD
jgi:hypothetical protein